MYCTLPPHSPWRRAAPRPSPSTRTWGGREAVSCLQVDSTEGHPSPFINYLGQSSIHLFIYTLSGAFIQPLILFIHYMGHSSIQPFKNTIHSFNYYFIHSSIAIPPTCGSPMDEDLLSRGLFPPEVSLLSLALLHHCYCYTIVTLL